MRFLKQLAYGSFYLLVFGLIGSGIFMLYFYEAPTCFDGVLNQDEVGVDCGGVCVICEIKNATLGAGEVRVIEAGAGRITLLASVTNPINYSATFEYKISIIGSFGTLLRSISDSSSVGPGDQRFIIIPGVTFGEEDVSRATIEITKAKWNEEQGVTFPFLAVRGAETSIIENNVRVTGRLFNSSLDVVKRVRITVILFDEYGDVLSGSAVDVENIGVSEEKTFNVFFPELDEAPDPSKIQTRIFSEITPAPWAD